jgi:class 3 adenylate cyclase/pimeloyl-ACP methyl ester carboxylesterase
LFISESPPSCQTILVGSRGRHIRGTTELKQAVGWQRLDAQSCRSALAHRCRIGHDAVVSGPVVKYARSGDVHIAYAVMGEGPIDIVYVPGFASNVSFMLDPARSPVESLWFERMSRFGRVIVFDKRGTGLSDRSVDVPSLDVRMDDVRAVMEAVGSERAALVGLSEGGPMSILFAATFPERTHSLTLYGSFATFVRTDDHPWMPTTQDRAATRSLIEEHWGTGLVLAAFAPEGTVTDDGLAELAAEEMASASPAAIVRLMEMNEHIDVRSLLSTVAVPALVVHATGDQITPFACGQYLAEHLPDATLLALDYAAHMGLEPSGPIVEWLDDFEEFITGVRPLRYLERVLSTIMYTDIVDSTALAASVGDDTWKRTLDRHDRLVRDEIDRHRGIAIKSTGDGVLARFDGPARAVSCARHIVQRAPELGFAVRSGLHTGEIEIRGDDIAGIAAHIGARVAALAGPDEVLVSRTVRDLVAGSGIEFEDRGEHRLKGVPESWHLYLAV